MIHDSGGYVILIQPIPPPFRFQKKSVYRGSCASYICRRPFKTDETRANVESQRDLLEPCSDHKPPVLENEVGEIGSMTYSPRLFHLQCLHELLSYDNGIGICPFAERVYPEPRGSLRGPRGSWQPTVAEQVVIETWKAVHVYINSQAPSSVITTGTIPGIVALDGYNYQLRAGPHQTLFQTKEAFAVFSMVTSTSVPPRLQATVMPNRPLHFFLKDKSSMKALEQIIDTANHAGPMQPEGPLMSLRQQEIESQNRKAYRHWMGAQGLGLQGLDSYYCQDKASKEEKDHIIALKLAHWDPDFKLSQWLSSSLNEAERNSALRRERYGIFSGMNLEKIGEEGPAMGVLAEEDMGEEKGEEAYEDDEETAASDFEDEEEETVASGEKAASRKSEDEAAKVAASGSAKVKQPQRRGKSKEKGQNKVEVEKKRKGSSEKKSEDVNDESPRIVKRRKGKNEKQSEKNGETDIQNKSEKNHKEDHEEEPASSKLEKEKSKNDHKDHEEEPASSNPEKERSKDNHKSDDKEQTTSKPETAK